MSKSKKEDRGFNALSRVITFILALGTFPLIIFTKLFNLQYTSSLLGAFQGDSGATYYDSSLYNLYKDGLLDALKSSESNASDVFAPLMKPLIATVVLYIIVCIIALVIMGFASFSNKKLPIMCLSGGALVCMGGIAIAFHFIEKPLINGTITLGSLTDKWWGSLLALLASFDGFKVGTGFIFLCLLFVGIILWVGAIMLVNSADTPKNVKAPKQPKIAK